MSTTHLSQEISGLSTISDEQLQQMVDAGAMDARVVQLRKPGSQWGIGADSMRIHDDLIYFFRNPHEEVGYFNAVFNCNHMFTPDRKWGEECYSHTIPDEWINDRMLEIRRAATIAKLNATDTDPVGGTEAAEPITDTTTAVPEVPGLVLYSPEQDEPGDAGAGGSPELPGSDQAGRRGDGDPGTTERPVHPPVG